jgi:hypothetical protein
MPNNTWSAGGAGNWSVNGNWSLGVAPVLADDVIFDATSVQDCTIDVSPSVNSITFTAAYSGNWSAAGQTMTCALGFSHDGTGTSNFGNGLTCNGNASTLHVGAGVGVVTATSCVLTMNGTTAMVLDDDKGIRASPLTLGPNAVVTNNGAQLTRYESATTPLIVADGAIFTSNINVNFSLTGPDMIVNQGVGSVINGTSNITFILNTGVVATIPAFTYTGSGLIIFTDGGGGTGASLTLMGTFNSGTARTIFFNQGAGTTTYNFNNQDVTTGRFDDGASGGGTCVYNYGSGTFNITSYTSNYIVGTTVKNFQTSRWTCTGDWTFASTHTVDPGASSVTIANTSTITSNGKSFYDLTVNAAAKVITCADALTCAAGGDLTLTAGTLTLATFNLTVGGNTAINGVSTLNATGSTCSFAGNYSTAVASTVTVNAATNYTFTAATIITTNGITLPSCTFNNNFTINNSCVITRLITGVNGFTGTFQAGNIFTITNYTAGDWDGAFGALSSYQSSIPGTQATFIAPAFVGDLTVRYTRWTDINANFGETIYANDGTSQNGGNNDNIIFPAGGAGRRLSDSKIAIGMGI